MTNGTRTNAPYLIVGFCFMLLGILLVLDRLEIVEAVQVLQFWPVGLVLLGGSMMVQAMRGGDGRNNFPVGAVIWLVLLGLLFSHAFERRSAAARNDDGERVSLFALMSGDRRTNLGEHFRGGEMTSIMGGTQLDLRQATMAPGEEAVIDVFAVMGGAIVRIPEGWIVDVQATSVMGGIKDQRRGNRENVSEESESKDAPEPPESSARAGIPEPPEPPEPVARPEPPAPPVATGVEREDGSVSPGSAPPRLVLRGFVMMGGLIIRS